MSDQYGAARPMPCPRCGATVAPDQDWCLDCGAAARTRIATTPRWQTPVAVVFGLLALAIGGLGFAFADLTADAGRLAPAPTTTTPVQLVPPASTPATVPPVVPLPETSATTTTTTTTTLPAVPGSNGGSTALPQG